MIKNPCHFVDSTDIIKYLDNIKGNIKGEKQQFIKRCNMETNHGIHLEMCTFFVRKNV